MKHKVIVRIFALPMVACDPGKTWKAAAEMMARRLKDRYGDAVQVEFVEIFAPESFQYPEILALLQNDQAPPFVTLNGKLIQSGGKLSERAIRTVIEELLTCTNGAKSALETVSLS
ncbi:hypothetical protein U27_03635 [Candidatus Vecturithrix granuli]|uniref:Thioredoxin-like fold domain-containing protein n=1 Tax=Vecturithrix granuli TaxID=1499967 RepID=A0A081BWG7_VECG1|nr:hypothetical protein U27_03635 [Candidatus Vecturithrix granuli]